MGSDQRKFDRIPEVLDAQCRPTMGFSGNWRVIATLDISAGGIGFQTQELFETSDTVEIQLRLPGMPGPLVLPGMVVRSRPLPSGLSECAVEFTDVSPSQRAELDALVQFLRKKRT
jgi:c-di-GMP-binding flagellar brake protein YcgR